MWKILKEINTQTELRNVILISLEFNNLKPDFLFKCNTPEKLCLTFESHV